MEIKDYLISNKEHLVSLLQPHKDKKNFLEDSLPFFNGEIELQYVELRRNIIATEITKSLAISYEDVIVYLEDINLEEFLK